MKYIYPDIKWYTKISDDKKVTPRCPFASVHRCPRYFQGISLLGEEGNLSKLDTALDKEIGNKWENTDLWPAARHEFSGILSSNKKPFEYRDFCPEVIAEAFGLFASTLIRYSDEYEREAASKWLAKQENISINDWRRQWSSVSEMHYTYCPLYSLLSVSLKPITITEKPESIVTAKPSMFGFSIDLKQLLTRFSRWWLSKQN